MRCEIVAVGTELLLGQIVDTNSAWIGEQLALAGIDCHRHTAVGDNRDRMRDAIADALGRADAVIVTGGLGPTQDDITREIGRQAGDEGAVAVGRKIHLRSGEPQTVTIDGARQSSIRHGESG